MPLKYLYCKGRTPKNVLFKPWSIAVHLGRNIALFRARSAGADTVSSDSALMTVNSVKIMQILATNERKLLFS